MRGGDDGKSRRRECESTVDSGACVSPNSSPIQNPVLLKYIAYTTPEFGIATLNAMWFRRKQSS